MVMKGIFQIGGLFEGLRNLPSQHWSFTADCHDLSVMIRQILAKLTGGLRGRGCSSREQERERFKEMEMIDSLRSFSF